mmetsp:Transcript_6340/g.10719  ORF Transcript_6340/g.10719 Transcript_6340/m.10719 type:complete len:566 (-) Transcript_6340:51-1748(-)
MVLQSLRRGSWGQRKQTTPASACAPPAEPTPQHLQQQPQPADAETEVQRLREQLRLAEARLQGSGTNHTDLQNSTCKEGAPAENVTKQGRSMQENDLGANMEASCTLPRTNGRSMMHGPGCEQSPLATRQGAHANEPGLQRQLVEGQSVCHHRCDNAAMPTALRARPHSGAPPLQDVRAEPGEIVRVLHTQAEVSDGVPVMWVRVACETGEGWLKQMHLRESENSRMMHERGDNPLLPTALRERPTNTARPLDNVKAEAREQVVVHVRREVAEAGRQSTWAKVSCALGKGWIKVEHLRELAPTAKDEDRPSVSAVSTSNPESGPLPVQSTKSTPMQSQNSLSGKQTPRQHSATCSEYPASGIRIRLGTLEFAAGSVISNTSIFERVGIIALVQMGGSLADDGPPALWTDDAPVTELMPVKYGRVVSDDGRYATRMLCAFNSAAVDMPWPPNSRTPRSDEEVRQMERMKEPKKKTPLPDKVAVDIWLERTTVVDRFDRALGSLGFHHPAEYDRRWLGRAVAELPPEGVDDAPFAWSIERGPKDPDCPEPNTLQIGVEWLMEDRLEP